MLPLHRSLRSGPCRLIMIAAVLAGAGGLATIAPSAASVPFAQISGAKVDKAYVRDMSACLLARDAQPLQRPRDELTSQLFAPALHAVYFTHGPRRGCHLGHQLKG